MTQQERKEFYKSIVIHFNTNDSTVRKTAAACETSKSTVHKVLTIKMPNPVSAQKLEKNKRERHIRGGEATRRKYLGE